MKPLAVFYVLKYLTISDFISSIICCRAWNYALHKPCYWRVLQKNSIRYRFFEPLRIERQQLRETQLKNVTKLKRINHAVMQLKIEPKKFKISHGSSVPKPDDIYRQCMQQLQKVIAQSEQDREEWNDKVRAQQAILKFMEASMYAKMHELSELRVRKWSLKHMMNNEILIRKREFNKKVRLKERELLTYEENIMQVRDKMMKEEKIRLQREKIRRDLLLIDGNLESQGALENQLRKIKSQNKRLRQVMMQLNAEIPKREKEAHKYREKVELLQHQFTGGTPNSSLSLP